MAFVVELPQVGESVTEGVIGRWLVSEGQTVKKYDPLVEVMTDKVNMEMPSPASGVLTRILAAEGETLPMGSPIAEIDAEDEPAPAPPAPADTLGTLTVGLAVGPTGAANVPQQDAAPVAPSEAVGGERERFSPAVRRLAERHGIDPRTLSGTGAGGRVTRRDVERHLAREGESGGSETVPGDEDRSIEVTPVRRMIAANMVRSAAEIPHAWSMVEVDVTGLVALRKTLAERFSEDTGHRLTYLPFAVSAAAAALRAHPIVNSSWAGDQILIRGHVNVGIAVASPGGLIVPVIRDADRLTVAELAVEIGRLSEAARSAGLSPGQTSGGTFTVNNTGALGSVSSGPILVPGQSAILTTEAVQKRPVVVGDDAIAVRSIMNMCISFDHRVLDGAEVGAFMQSVRGALEGVGTETSLDRVLSVEPGR